MILASHPAFGRAPRVAARRGRLVAGLAHWAARAGHLGTVDVARPARRRAPRVAAMMSSSVLDGVVLRVVDDGLAVLLDRDGVDVRLRNAHVHT